MAKIHEITVKAPINIALIKYWGKRNEKLILPLNDSISVSIDELFATTRIYIGSHIEENSITVNGKKLDQGHMQRFEMVFQECEKLVYRRKRQAVEDFAWTNWHMEIDSRTNFPTSAGLASSAAGFAAIAFGIGQIFGFDEKDIVRLARIGFLQAPALLVEASRADSCTGGPAFWIRTTRTAFARQLTQ